MKKALWIITVGLALSVGFIPITYLINGISEGYLSLKSQEVIRSKTWLFFLYTHMISGGIAILIGWIQFNGNLLKKRPHWHRTIGKLYVNSALLCSVSGFYIGFYATGGWPAALGFITVSCIYFYTTLKGFLHIRNGQLTEHQNYMTYSYATCLAAVSLRVSVPLSSLITDDYILSYILIAWLAWIPNLIIAYWVNQGRQSKKTIDPILRP
jgi:uncharacterized membrane protein